MKQFSAFELSARCKPPFSPPICIVESESFLFAAPSDVIHHASTPSLQTDLTPPIDRTLIGNLRWLVGKEIFSFITSFESQCYRLIFFLKENDSIFYLYLKHIPAFLLRIHQDRPTLRCQIARGLAKKAQKTIYLCSSAQSCNYLLPN